MRCTRILGWVVAASLFVGAFMMPFAGTPAFADSSTPLPLTDFGGMVVDSAHSHVFVSGHGSVVVLDYSGSIVTNITGEAGASGLALDASTSTLYVALNAGEMAIDKIDTDTLQKTGTIPLQSGGYHFSPTGSIAFDNGLIWFAAGLVGDCSQNPGFPGGFGSVKPDGSGLITYGGTGYPSLCTYLATSPGDLNLLFAWEPNRQPPTLYEYDISSGSPALSANQSLSGLTSLEDVTTTPDSSTVLTAATSPSEIDQFLASDLSPTGTPYPVSAHPDSVVGTGAGGGYLAAATDASSDPDLYVFPLGSPSPKSAIALLDGVYPRGLAFNADASKLFAVMGVDSKQVAFAVLDHPVDLYSSSLSLSASPNPAFVETPITLSGTLSMLGPQNIAGQIVHLSRLNPDNSRTNLPDATTDALGAYSETDSPPAGDYTYTVTWDGDGDHRGSTASVDEAVNKYPSSVRLTTSASVVRYGKSVTVTAHLNQYNDASNKTLFIYVTPYGGAKTLVASGPVDESGNLAATIAPKKNSTFVADYAGDDKYLPAESNKVTVRVRVIVRGALSGYYGVSGKYRLYHYTPNCTKFGKGCPTLTVTVLPNHPGQYVYITLQVYVGGAWRTALAFKVRLNARSKAIVIFVYDSRKIIGIPTRARAQFKGDADHLGAYSSWSYFKVTR
jgi:hypothetical protein